MVPVRTAQIMARGLIRPGLAVSTGGVLWVAVWTLTRLQADQLAKAVASTDAMLSRLALSLALSCLVVTVGAGLLVRWHRNLLLGERPTLLASLRPTARDGHCAALLLFGAVAVHAAFGLLDFALGLGLDLAASGAVGMGARLGLGLGLLYVLCRCGLVLPAAALGRPIDIATSWRLTRPGCHRAFIPLVAVALPCALMAGGLGALNLPPLASHTLSGVCLVAFVSAAAAALSVNWRRHGDSGG